METNFKISYGVSKLYDPNFKPLWSNEYMDAMREGIITAPYISEGSSCSMKRLKKKIKKDNNKVDYIGSGAYAKVWCIDHPDDMRYSDNVYVLKNTKYDSDDEEDDEEENAVANIRSQNINNNVNAEVRMIRLLNDLVYSGVTPHILLYIKHAQCLQCTKPSMQLVTEICKSSVYDVGKEEDNEGNEKWPYMRHLDILVFQVMFTLDAIQAVYPKWRHNDLRTDNVFVDKVEKKNYYYQIDGKYYKIYTNMFVKISDFGHSNLQGIIDNDLTKPEKEIIFDKKTKKEKEVYLWDPESYGMRATENKYYDMHTFLNSINVTFIDDDGQWVIDENMQALLEEFVPIEYRTTFKVTKTAVRRNKNNKNVSNQDTIVPDIEPFVPNQTMKYFEHFRIQKEEIPEGEHIFGINN